MITLTTAENALKTVYLGALSNQLNVEANPLLSKIKHSNADVWGKEIRKMAPVGINGGVGAGTEEGVLPSAYSNTYVQFVSTLKNLYGMIEISDKAIRASQSSVGAFVDLLNAEMEGLVKASTFNLGRMLYGDGSGILCKILNYTNNTFVVEVDDTRNLIEGLVIQAYDTINHSFKNWITRIVHVNRATKVIKVEKKFNDIYEESDGIAFVVQSSYNNEITGLGRIFASTGTLYGLDKSTYPFLNPFVESSVGDISDAAIQEAIDNVEEGAGSTIDLITCSYEVKRAYQTYLATYRRNIDVMELAGGYKAMSYNGIPVVADRFVESDSMYLLNTKDFTLHELCDWSWLQGEDGRILRQRQSYPTFMATLVKYADLICDHPSGQAKLTGITIS